MSAAAERLDLGPDGEDGRCKFIRDNTKVMTVPLVPEVKLHLAEESIPIWEKTEEELGEVNLPPPFWAFAWAGGQALARYILDNPETVANRDVLDLGCGCGITCVASIQAGARSVLGADIDPMALTATRLNAKLNTVHVDVTDRPVLDEPPIETVKTILVADLFYDRNLATHVLAYLDRELNRGCKVLIGDPKRAYLPLDRLHKVASYNVPVTRELEDAELKNSGVWTLAPPPAP